MSDHSRRGEIGLGDLVEALVALKPGPPTASLIAASLGLEWSGKGTLQMETDPERAPGVSEPASLQPPVADQQPFAAPIELQPVRTAKTSLKLVSAAPRGTRNPLNVPEVRTQSSKPPYRPLFREKWWRTLARVMFSMQTARAAVDISVITRYVASGRPMQRLPWMYKATLRRGVVLILDRAESMQPFWRDEIELAEALKRVVGGPGLRVYRVEPDLWAEGEPRLRWHGAEPGQFAAHTPVAIVSDFELGREITPRWPLLAPWMPLLDKVQAAGAPMLALIPLPRTLWPPSLTAAIPKIVAWDDDTTTGTIQRSLS